MLTVVMAVLAEPVLEHAPAPKRPWTAVADTFLGERSDGSWGMNVAGEDGARFYRVLDVDGGVGFGVMGIRVASRVRFLPDSLDSDGDRVPDCVDVCPGHAGRMDTDNDGLADGCDPDPQVRLGMALTSAGPFEMGDSFGTGRPEARPLHTVEVSAFSMDRHEITWALWQEARAGAELHSERVQGS